MPAKQIEMLEIQSEKKKTTWLSFWENLQSFSTLKNGWYLMALSHLQVAG